MPSKTKRMMCILVMNLCLCLSLVFLPQAASGLKAGAAPDPYPPDRPDSPNRPETPSRPGELQEPPAKITPPPPTALEQNDRGGSHIVLQIENYQQEYWSEVEWVDGAGVWHVVEGWRGQSTQGAIRWFVEKKDLGKGPFRHHIYDHKDGTDLGISEQFYLPKQTGMVEIINLRLPVATILVGDVSQ